jgi:hypothetical protein
MIHGYCSPSSALIVIAALAAAPELLMAQATRDLAMPERVQFGSADGKTTLVGYVFKSAVQPGVRVPAVVMMHGRAGPYSSLAKGVYDATTLSQRHQFWGRLWVAQGYIAILMASDRAAIRRASAATPMHRVRRNWMKSARVHSMPMALSLICVRVPTY